MNEDLHATVSRLLQRTRQRYTRGRRQLVALLSVLDRPVGISDLLDAGADQSQSSLYRNLAILEQAGAVRRLTSIDDAARYELAEELTQHHHHVVCQVCGRVDDVTLPGTIERALRRAADEARVQRGFEVDAHHLELVGTCTDCR